MTFYADFRAQIVSLLSALIEDGTLPRKDGGKPLDMDKIAVEPPRDPSHGHMACNAAMVAGGALAAKPRDIAEALAQRLRSLDHVERVDVAGPGFLNLTVDETFWRERLKAILRAGDSYGQVNVGQGTKINVEFVSANPTGPMHVAHARGAVVGDALAAVLEKAGYEVCREYYINDAGQQVAVLSDSAFLRYREALGEEGIEIPEGLYPGEYLKDVGRKLAERHGDTLLDLPEGERREVIRRFAVEEIMRWIKHDLDVMDVAMDVFFSERSLIEQGDVDAVEKTLTEKGLLYEGILEPPKGKTPEDWEPREQLLFKATDFGDDVDRPLKKSNGDWTYFASDIAYHLNKFRRDYARMIDVWGADHGGYIKRMKAAVSAVTGGEGSLDVQLCQLVKVLKDGKPVRMSKRAGSFITLGDLLDEVEPGVIRFIMLTRRNDQALDFDLDQVKEKSKENLYYYVQYAHARCRSVLRHGAHAGHDTDEKALAELDLSPLTHEGEIELIRLLADFPRTVEGAAQSHEPHRIVNYLSDLAAAFHAHWNRGNADPALRFLAEDDQAVFKARLALVAGVALTIRVGLALVSVEAAEEM